MEWALWIALIAVAGSCVAILIAHGEHRDANEQRQRSWRLDSENTKLRISRNEWMNLAVARQSVIEQQIEIISDMNIRLRAFDLPNREVSFEQLMGDE